MATSLATKRAKFARCPPDERDHWRGLVWESPSDDTLALAFADWAMENGEDDYAVVSCEIQQLRELAARCKAKEVQTVNEKMREWIANELRTRWTAKHGRTRT